MIDDLFNCMIRITMIDCLHFYRSQRFRSEKENSAEEGSPLPRNLPRSRVGRVEVEESSGQLQTALHLSEVLVVAI